MMYCWIPLLELDIRVSLPSCGKRNEADASKDSQGHKDRVS